MKAEAITAQDRRIIGWQIRREPRNLYGVARRCKKQCPKVIINHPLSRKKTPADIFPTVFWLTCPKAVQRIGRIEDQGNIQRIQHHITNNFMLARNMRDAHQEYIFIRRSLVESSTLNRVRISEKKVLKNLERLGIGGVADIKGIKCLHAHYAHYLATGNNPVGQLVADMIRLSDDSGYCRDCHNRNNFAGVAE